MKSYFKQHEVNYSTQRLNCWQILRVAWRQFVTFMHAKWDYSRYRSGIAASQHVPGDQEQCHGSIESVVHPRSLEAERQWLEEIYRNS